MPVSVLFAHRSVDPLEAFSRLLISLCLCSQMCSRPLVILVAVCWAHQFVHVSCTGGPTSGHQTLAQYCNTILLTHRPLHLPTVCPYCLDRAHRWKSSSWMGGENLNPQHFNAMGPRHTREPVSVFLMRISTIELRLNPPCSKLCLQQEKPQTTEYRKML